MPNATNFGKDTSCTDSLRTGRFVTGARLVGEAAYRRLTTPPGTLRGGEDEQNYGLDLSAMIGMPNPALIAASLPGRIRTELLKDERINDATATVALSTEGAAQALDITVVGETDEGPFELVLAVSEVTTRLVGLSA